MDVKFEYDVIESAASDTVSESHEAFKYDSDNAIKTYESENIYDYNSNSNLPRNEGNHALLTLRTRHLISLHNSSISEEDGSRNNDAFKDTIKSDCCKTNKQCLNKLICSDARLTSNEKMYLDKATYCRPVLNYYNEQFLYKIMERNARLKNLVKKLAIARQREKKIVNWNNFINTLKNKHGSNYEIQNPNNLKHPHEVNEEYIPEIIDDFNKTRFSCIQSKPSTHLLQDFYEAYDQTQFNPFHNKANVIKLQTINTYLPHERDEHCYPKGSQGILQINQKRCGRPEGYDYKTLRADNRGNLNKRTSIRRINERYKTNSMQVQTDVALNSVFIDNFTQNKATYKSEEDVRMISKKDVRNLQETKKSENSFNQLSLTRIDNKLETLIESLNKFIEEIKTNKANKRKCKINTIKIKTFDGDNRVKSESQVTNNEKGLNRTRKIHENAIIAGNSNQYCFPLDSTTRFLKDIDVGNTESKQIREKYKNQASMHIDFEVPTKDNTTEVTKSISKHDFEDKEEDIEEINLSKHTSLQRMTIAVNTDPLGLLSLLRISTDTIKQLLSYVPNINYYTYLSYLLFPRAREEESHYVCNICGVDFNRPLQLSHHVRSHDLGKTRDCCVCRHVLDLARKSTGEFRCQYCGELFARAYCCELHQGSCAKRFGRRHDVGSDLVLLR